MNALSNMQQFIYALYALYKVDCLLEDMQLSAKDELANSVLVRVEIVNDTLPI